MLAAVQCRKIVCYKCQEISCVESEGEIKTKGNTDSNVDLGKSVHTNGGSHDTEGVGA
jgi:hypothetical protein